MRSPTTTTTSNSRSLSMDKPILLGLLMLLLIYSIVTIATYQKISNQEAGAAALLSSSTEPVDSSLSAPSGASPNQQGEETSIEAAIEKLQHTFPIMVGDDDTEVIPHPGLSLVDPTKIPEGLPTTMTVPKFFDQSHGPVYTGRPDGSIRDYLGNYGERLMTPEEASHIGSFDADGHETIYCSVASYRDPECTETVEDIYARAEFPNRIRVAILDQRADDDGHCAEPLKPCDQAPEQALCQYRHLIDVFEMDARLAVGPVFARHLAHRHYRGEYYAMQVDSHVRFTKHWDSDIIAQWKPAKNEMAVLSTYLSDVIGRIDPVTFEGTNNGRPIMCKSDYEGAGANRHLRHGQQPEGPAGIHGEPTLHPFWAAGFSFARGHFVINVPYDQHLPMVFQGEEISIGLRGFTYGYDYYTPERGVCFHMYAIKENKEKRKIPLFWENSKVYTGVGVQAMKRLNSIIGMEEYPVTEWKHDDIQKYGLGKVRQPDKFFKTFGIHTDEHKVEDHLCRFVGKPMMKEFKPALRESGMGLDYDKINYVFVDPEKKKDEDKAKKATSQKKL